MKCGNLQFLFSILINNHVGLKFSSERADVTFFLGMDYAVMNIIGNFFFFKVYFLNLNQR